MSKPILMTDYPSVEFRVLASFAKNLSGSHDFNSEIFYHSLITAKDVDKRSFLMMSYGSAEGEKTTRELIRTYLGLGYV